MHFKGDDLCAILGIFVYMYLLDSFSVDSILLDKFIDLSKLKAFTDSIFNMSQVIEFVYNFVENKKGKTESVGY